MDNKKINLVLADDHQIVRKGIRQMLESEGYLNVVGEASDGAEALEVVQRTRPDVVIMDISMPRMTGIEATQAILKLIPDQRILILSMFDRQEYVLDAVQFGAYGYLLKDTDKERFIKAIKKVHAGEKYFSSEVANVIVNQYLHTLKSPDNPLPQVSANESFIAPAAPNTDPVSAERTTRFDITKREHQILTCIVNGLNNKAIAEHLGISVRTIETHRLHLMKKLAVSNAAELVRLALQEGLLERE